ncbi:MAG: 23S rRNA (adenine(2030)-N(6))-methyltransferase RlmJ [Spirochaetales bacterium]|nr:23S rRNA (adenine(2030)-N(6))-methyltransferase RlmJ [Spirochaetales bacterium]
MLSYRHGFHAGNHADVLKHVVLVDCITRLVIKDKAMLYIDTHAGAGSYALTEGFAAQNREYSGGIERLSAYARRHEPPAAVAAYMAATGYAALSPEAPALSPQARYPGSPLIAAGLLRPHDRLALFELHPADYEALSTLFAGNNRVTIHRADGFASLKSLMPPPSRRGFTLMDPSYEIAADYDMVLQTIADTLRRFATGVYAVWYPLLERQEAQALPAALSRLAPRWLDARLRVRGSAPGERGMAGSGMFVINPPWLVEDAMRESLPWLAGALGQDAGASWQLETSSGREVRYS